MPTYDYLCQNCEAKTEIFQKITDTPLKTCPYCESNSLKRGFGGGLGIQMSHKSFSHDGTYSCCPCGKSSPCRHSG
ncbi:MAG TPA: zinc ribbon domain-containing protein [Parachlamydiaceae bacterium]|nr:zinc ribbon domain-containing protein [Parachlamydiaceae bacterium]